MNILGSVLLFFMYTDSIFFYSFSFRFLKPLSKPLSDTENLQPLIFQNIAEDLILRIWGDVMNDN